MYGSKYCFIFWGLCCLKVGDFKVVAIAKFKY